MLEAGWKLVPPIFLPIRSFGVRMPEFGVDEDEAVAKAAVQEHRDRGQRFAAVAAHEIAADIDLADVELGLARHAPVALARAHAGEHDQLDAVGLHGAVAERAHDLVVAAGDGQFQLRHDI